MLGSNPSRMASLGAAVNGLPDDPYGPASMPAAQPDFSNAPPVPIQGQAMPSAPMARLPQKAGFNWLTFGQNFVNNYAAAQGSPVAQGWLKNQYDNEANSADQESKMKMMLARLQAEQSAPQHLGNTLQVPDGKGGYRVIAQAPDAPPAIAQEAAYLRSIGRNDLAELRLANFADPVKEQMGINPVTGQPYMGLYNRNGPVGSQGGGQAPSLLDTQPTVEDGHAYTPGPGGRANPANWHPLAQGGPTPRGAGTFPGPARASGR